VLVLIWSVPYWGIIGYMAMKEKLFCADDSHQNRENCCESFNLFRKRASWPENIMDRPIDSIRSEPRCEAMLVRQLITRLRRGAIPGDWSVFQELVEGHIDYYLGLSSSRTLLSILETYVDHGTTAESKNALIAISLISYEKLVQTRNQYFSCNEVESDGEPKLLWSGMTTFRTERGDMPRNFFARLFRTLSDTPMILLIFHRLMTDAFQDPRFTLRFLEDRVGQKTQFQDAATKYLRGKER